MKTKNIGIDVKQSKKKSHSFWKFFWLTFLAVSLGYAWYSFYAPSNDITWIDNMESAQKLANNSDKKIMIFFTGTWCSPCKMMKRQVFADQEVNKAMDAKVVSIEINIDDSNSEALIKQYSIGATPTTIFIDNEGNVIDYAVGKVGKAKFLEMLLNI
ncbi:thioredoxin family protein [Mesoflavibacter zeaxanthinifaciens]|uniref:thioredoxin family protein n=1 Tax=Mesoflavibacter zeaxanthinifaciens TaxID=393060 RepID=UPI003A95A792